MMRHVAPVCDHASIVAGSHPRVDWGKDLTSSAEHVFEIGFAPSLKQFHQRVGVGGFCEVGGGAQEQGFGEVLFQNGPAQDQPGHVAYMRLSLQPNEELEPVNSRHLDIGDNQTRPVMNVAEQFDGVFAVAGNEQRVLNPRCVESASHQEDIMLIIFNEEDGRNFRRRGYGHVR